MNWQNIFYSLVVPEGIGRGKLKARIKRRFQCDTWETKAGNVIPVIFMRESHMLNAYNHLFRVAQEAYRKSDPDAVVGYFKSMQILIKEFKRRNIPYNSIYEKQMAVWEYELNSRWKGRSYYDDYYPDDFDEFESMEDYLDFD